MLATSWTVKIQYSQYRHGSPSDCELKVPQWHNDCKVDISEATKATQERNSRMSKVDAPTQTRQTSKSHRMIFNRIQF